MTLLIDNYDSFTYNLYQMVETLGEACKVIRNDALSLEEIQKLGPDRVIISPGPGYPDSAGVSLDLIRHLQVPILGVCLGHQAIGQAFGAKVVRAPRPQHGKASFIFHQQGGLLSQIQSPFRAIRYHSLIVERKSLPPCLEITCETDDGLVMGLRHREQQIEGIQFHPESHATEFGNKMISAFLKRQRSK